MNQNVKEDYESCITTKHLGKLVYPSSEADLERQDKTLDKYNCSADFTTASLDTTASASLTTSTVNIAAAIMDQEESKEKERQQIKEWHDRVFKHIKKYDCLSREEINGFRVANDKK